MRSEEGEGRNDRGGAPRKPTAWMPSAFTRFWATDRSLTVLLVLLGVVVFVIYPLGNLGIIGRLFASLWFSLTLVSGVGAAAKSRLVTTLVGAVVVGNLVVHWLSFLRGGANLAVWDAAASLLFCAVLALVVLAQVFREGPITVHRIQGAVAVYLLLGLTWSFAYKLIDLSCPDAFTVSAPPGRPLAPADDHKWRFVYFSFVTLTTVGYGDITAFHPVARALVILEALTGQLFPAVLLARLVSMELYHRHSTTER